MTKPMLEYPRNREAQKAPNQKKHKSVKVSKAIFFQGGEKTGLTFPFFFFKSGPRKLYNSKDNQKSEMINEAAFGMSFSEVNLESGFEINTVGIKPNEK